MKRNKVILIALLAILILAYIILRLSNPVERTRKIFGNLSSNVEKIKIYNQDGEIDLFLDDGKWHFVDPVIWEADSLMISRFFADVLEADYATTPMSSGESAIQRYRLDDSQALHVQVQSANRELHVLFSNLGNAWDYFRFAGEDDVYQVRSKVVQNFLPEVIRWRSPLLIHYWEEDLKEIRVEHEHNAYNLYRLGNQWYYRDANNEFAVDFGNYALVKILSLLQNFRSYIFASGDDEELLSAFDTPMATVWITDTDDKVEKLSFAKFDNARFMLMVDDDPSILYQVEFDFVYRFTRNPEIFKRISF